MASKFSVYQTLGLLLLLLITSSNAEQPSYKKEISDINLHLPVNKCPSQQDCRRVKHELSASNGCYTW